MRDFTCCGLTLPTLHDLLQHYEETHSDQVPASVQRQGSNQNTFPPDPKAARAAVVASNMELQGPGQQKPPQIETSRPGQVSTRQSPTPATPRQAQPAQQVPQGFGAMQSSQSQEDDTIGDMEMDDDYGALPINPQQSQNHLQNQARMMQRSQFGQPTATRVPPLDMNVLNLGNPVQHQHHGLRNSQPATPVSAGRNGNIYQHNPTVSSVNTPTFTTHPVQQVYYTPESSAPGTPGELDSALVGDLGNMNMGGMQYVQHPNYGYATDQGRDMLDLCIDEPAKRLFALNGGHTSDYAQPQQSEGMTSAIQLGDGQYSEDSEIAKTIREEQKRAGVPDPSSKGPPKPFHCPVIGCEKAYKNHNGLKYHKTVSSIVCISTCGLRC